MPLELVYQQEDFQKEHEDPPEPKWTKQAVEVDYFYQAPEGYVWKAKLENNIEELKKELRSVKVSVSGIIHIQRLQNYSLSKQIDVIVEPDDDGFIARAIDLPLYAFSEDSLDAIEALKCEIESLYEDLMEDDNFTPEFLRIKKFLTQCIDAE